MNYTGIWELFKIIVTTNKKKIFEALQYEVTDYILSVTCIDFVRIGFKLHKSNKESEIVSFAICRFNEILKIQKKNSCRTSLWYMYKVPVIIGILMLKILSYLQTVLVLHPK
jgi:hypothetical protein